MRSNCGCVSVALLLSLMAAGCGSTHTRIDSTTEVSVLPKEDLSGPCVFQLTLAEQVSIQRGVIVIYERGDSVQVFGSPELRQMAQQLQFSIVFAQECDAKSYRDLQSDPTKGPGRVLFQALSQFASATGHSELSNAGVILYGFSAGGVLAAEMASYAPDRVLGVVGYASGSAHQDVSAFRAVPAALAIPSLFLANALDVQAGTTRSHDYFTKGRARGAVWAYGVQQGEGHCCTRTTLPVVVPWMAAVIAAESHSASQGWFICSPNGVKDAQKKQDCSVTSAGLGVVAAAGGESVWLPDAASSQKWLTWVTNTAQN